jgi:acetylglutamate kinase
LDNGLVPICNPVTHDGKGQLLNTNADTIAASIASSLASKFHIELIFCFELAGVLEDINRPDSVISKLRRHDYLEYQKLGIIQNGMIPKLDNAFFALQQQVAKVYITNAENILNPEKCTEICL